MKMKYLAAMFLISAFLFAGCGESSSDAAKEDAKEEVQENTAPAKEVLAESNEEYGEIEAENTDEETGEVLDEFSIESSIEADKDALIVHLSTQRDSDMSWKYTIADEAIIALESENYIEAPDKESSDSVQYIFKAAQAGETSIGMDYLGADEEPDTGEDAWHDVTVQVSVADDMTITFTEE